MEQKWRPLYNLLYSVDLVYMLTRWYIHRRSEGDWGPSPPKGVEKICTAVLTVQKGQT